MKAIISGATGNLGTHIISNAEFETISLRRDNWGVLDSTSFDKSDIFVHCAYDLKNSIKDKPDEVIDSNVSSTMKALRLIKEKGIGKFIFISSCSIYGRSNNTEENSSCSPITTNGLSKYLCEKVIEEFCQHNSIDYLILRVFNTYGGKDSFSIISKIVDAAKNKSSILLNNGGQAARDYVHINDVAKIVCFYCLNNSNYNILNVGTGIATRVIDIVNSVEEKLGPIKKVKGENPYEVNFSKADITRISKEVNIEYTQLSDYLSAILK